MRAQHGFTLIEILVALLVFLTGVTGLLALITTALAMHRDGLLLARATRDIDAVVAQVQREVAAGQHRDAVRGLFVDVEAAELPDGTVYAVHFLAERGEQPLLAELRVAGNRKALPRSRPLPLVLASQSSRQAAIESFRNRGRPPAEPPPAEPVPPGAREPEPPPESQPPPGDH